MDQKLQERKALPTFVWIIILLAVFSIAVTVTLIGLKGDEKRAVVSIYVKGVCVKQLPIDQDTVYRNENENGFNVIEISGGRVRILESDCGEQTCVKTGWISGSLMPIVCLPHELIVLCENTVQAVDEPDIISY